MNAKPSSEESPAPDVSRLQVAEVKYSLPNLLEELKAERAAASFAMEKLDQHEIGKLFKSKSTRGKSKK